MTEVTRDMVVALLREIAGRTSDLDERVGSVLTDLRGLNADLARMRDDFANIACILSDQDRSLERIADRLDANGAQE